MATPFGIQGTIDATVSLDGLDETFDDHGLLVEVANNLVRIGYQRADQEQDARRSAETLILSWKFHHGITARVDFDRSWHPGPEGQQVTAVSHTARFAMGGVLRVQAVVRDLEGNTVVTPSSHPYSVARARDLLVKVVSDPALERALSFFTEEVIDNDRPLYGIYKALEVLIGQLASPTSDGRRELAYLAGQTKGYVGDVMETAQTERHAKTHARRKLSDDQCRDRARLLIDAYAWSLSAPEGRG